MDSVVSKLREEYQLVYITDEEHELLKSDIKINLNLPNFFFNDPDHWVDGLTDPSHINKIFFFLKNPKFVNKTIDYLKKAINKISKTINIYDPIKIIVHQSNLLHLLCLNVFDKIQTYIIYFAPGFIPSVDIPFIFHERLKRDKLITLYNHNEKDFNESSGYQFQDSLLTLSLMYMNIKLFFDNEYTYLKKIIHITCFNSILIPKINYSIPHLKIKNVGTITAKLIERPLSKKIKNWINKSNGKIVFFSLGSFINQLLTSIPQLFDILNKACIKNKTYVVFHLNKLLTKKMETVDFSNIYFHSGFICYNNIVKHCSLVCFTGSLCLQNICWLNECRMLYIPFLTEQYFWAKLYKMYTNIDYIDYLDNDVLDTFIYKFTAALNLKMKIFFRKIKESFTDDAPCKIKNEILK